MAMYGNGDTEAFVEALTGYVADAVRRCGDMEYCHEAVKICDARNPRFQSLTDAATDEEHSVYALRELCRLDADTMSWHANEGRIRAVARDFF